MYSIYKLIKPIPATNAFIFPYKKNNLPTLANESPLFNKSTPFSIGCPVLVAQNPGWFSFHAWCGNSIVDETHTHIV